MKDKRYDVYTSGSNYLRSDATDATISEYNAEKVYTVIQNNLCPFWSCGITALLVPLLSFIVLRSLYIFLFLLQFHKLTGDFSDIFTSRNRLNKICSPPVRLLDGR